jgi:hypothetical protein
MAADKCNRQSLRGRQNGLSVSTLLADNGLPASPDSIADNSGASSLAEWHQVSSNMTWEDDFECPRRHYCHQHHHAGTAETTGAQ